MKQYTNPSECALDLLEEGKSTSARQAALFRALLADPANALVNVVPLTFSQIMSASAYLALQTTFGGRAVCIMNPMAEVPPRDGFYVRGQALFHANSDEFETRAVEHEGEARDLASYLVSSGVNTFQAAEMLPLGSLVYAVFTGTFTDWARLVRGHANITKASHPHAREFVLEVWTALSAQCPQLVEAYAEQP